MDDVVALNALIVTAIGLSFAFSSNRDRKNRARSPLDFGAKRRTAIDDIDPRVPVPATRKEPYGTTAMRRLEREAEAERLYRLYEVGDPATERQLNVFFNWNGHTWDAYEVLGLPAGAPRDEVVAAFRSQRLRSPDSTAFLQAATDAILKR